VSAGAAFRRGTATHGAARRLDAGEARHLLRRLCFGAAPGEVDGLVGRARGEVVEELVATARTAPVDDDVRLLLPAGEIEHLSAWWLDAMLGAPGARLRERLALVWHDHFATSHAKVQDVHLMYGQNRLLRTQGLGDFRVLLHAVVVDPAMLVWLDGVENRKGHPNENLARELMELFALGIGTYTEADVLEAARGLSGWTVRQRRAHFEARLFDDGEKRVLGRRGRLGLHEVVDTVVEQAAAPRWIAQRLWRAIHASEPTPDELDAAARELVAVDWDVGRLLVWLATRDRFHAAVERDTRLSSPVEYVVRAQLELGTRLAPIAVSRAAARMGQALFRPPSVKGWDGGRAWFTSTAWIARQRFAAALAQAADERPVEAVRVALLGRLDAPWLARVLAVGAQAPRAAVAAILASPEYQLQ
jgi:uncharacterized protein (DUF1800 family)